MWQAGRDCYTDVYDATTALVVWDRFVLPAADYQMWLFRPWAAKHASLLGGLLRGASIRPFLLGRGDEAPPPPVFADLAGACYPLSPSTVASLAGSSHVSLSFASGPARCDGVPLDRLPDLGHLCSLSVRSG